MRRAVIVIGLMALVVAPLAARQTGAKVKGQIIRVEQHVRTQNGGEFVRLTVRTRQGEEMQLHLGSPGTCEDCYRVGDRVRARLAGGPGDGEAQRVQTMKVRRGGEQFSLCQEGAGMKRQQAQAGQGPGGGQRGRGQGSHGNGSGGGRGRGGV